MQGIDSVERERTLLLIDENSAERSDDKNHSEALTYNKAIIELSKTAGSTALISIFYAINGFVMSVSFAELGHIELAAAGLITTGQLLIYNSFSGGGRSSGILIADKHKKNNYKAVAELFKDSLLYSTVLGVLSTGTVLATPIFLALLNNQRPLFLWHIHIFFHLLLVCCLDSC